MKRGSIYWVNLEPASPPEMGKVRPAVVVSNSEQNEILDSVVVVPLSSRAGEIWPLRIEMKVSGKKASYAVVPAIRQISKRRLENFVGQASLAMMNRLQEGIRLYLSD